MAEEIPFSPLDPLGPEYGSINAPIVDAKGLSAFEGDTIKESPINFPTGPSYQPTLPGVGNLNRPNRSIQENLVKTNAVNPSIPKKKLSTNDLRDSINKSLDSFFQSNQDKNQYAKIFTYNAGPDGNAFYKRYHAYGQETFDKIGFSPLRDNEAAFNAQTTRWDDFSRMWTHSFTPLLTSGFTAGPKSLFKALQGDFTSGDLEDAKIYENAAAIGQSSKGGVFGFVNNTMMNFGYTAGIMGEAIIEEAAGALLAAPTGGTSLFATTANNLRKFGSLFKSFDKMGDGYRAVKTTLQNASTITGARKIWEAAKSSDFLTTAARGLNPLENTFDAVKQLRQADNITDLAILSKTAGGFYRDIRKINMALSEARLEAGMVENHIYDKLYNEAYKANGNQLPSNKELAAIEKQAKEASLSTLTSNVGLIYASNAITFNNITGPRGGLRNFLKSTTEDVYQIASREGSKNFGKLGKVVYDRTTKAFELQKNNIVQLTKNWIKNPGYKTLASTVGYFKANFTEGFQENLQEVIAGANEKYYMDSYKSPTLQRQLYSMGVIKSSMAPKKDYFSNELSAQFTGQGLETFASGFFMGTLAGPVNNAIPFLSTSYNKIFNKEEYATWKKDQLAIATGLVDRLNKMDLKTFMTDRNLNLGAQDLVSKVRQRGSKKVALDAETEAYVSQINNLRGTGTFNLFTEKILSYKDATDKELADALGVKEEQAEKYRARLDIAVERMNRVNAAYDRAEQKYPNPVDITQLTDPNAPDFNEKVLLHNAWNQGIKNMVFFNETYDDILSRREAIKNKYNTSKNFQSIDSYEKDLLYQPEKMYDEMELLDKEIALEKELGKNPKKLKQLEERKNALNNFFQNYLRFDVFFNREDYADSIAEELQKETGKEPTTEEILKRMDQKYGSLDNETQKTELIKNLNKVHNEYLKTLAGHRGNQAFDENNSQAFELLMDYYKMGMESKKIAQYINLMNDPQSFLEAVRRNTEWMRKFTAQRVKYFEDLVHSEMGKVRDNAFLNALANKGYYMNAEDMENYLGGKNIPPKEIYNHITKEVYPQGSKEYNEIYKEYFQKRADLKAQQNPRKTGIVATAYEKQIQDLKDQMEQEIADLPTELVKINQQPIGKEGETLSYAQVVEALEVNQYAELTYQDGTESTIIFKDENNDIRYNNAEGDFVDIEDLADAVFTSAIKFDYEARPDENLVKAIRENYENKIKEVEEAYIRDNQVIEDEIPFEEITQDDNLKTADLREFRNMLYEKFVNEHLPSLPEDIQDLIAEDQELEDFEFEKWYKLPENKKYFDEYNQKNKPKGQKTEAIITFEGQDIDTKDLSLDELTRYRDRINTAIDEAEDDLNYTDIEESPEETKALQDSLRELKKQIKAINSVIQLRQFANFSPAIKDGVRKIQKLLAAQKGVEERYLLTEDDPTTGLKEGQVAYRVNGLIHRRVTNAMQDVLGKEYEYGGKANVEKAYNLTIGKDGLNDVSISDFITQLNALLASRTASYNPLPGANEKLVLKLQDELSKLSGLSPEEIKIEREKDKLFQQSDSILRKLVAAEEEGNATRVVNLTKQKAEVDKKLVDLQQKLNALKGKGTAPASSKITDNSISNGDKIISVQTKPVTDEIVNSDGELFITADKDPEGKIYINMEPLKNVLVVPNNTLTVIDKTTGKEIVNQELNPEGAVMFEAMQGRLFVVANVNGQLIPFYKSSSGTDGKTQGAWYPFFGYTGSWLVKGGIDKSTGKMEYSPEIDKVTTLLNENLIFPDKYINRVTNNIKNTDGELVYDFNNHFKVNRIWQKAFQSSTGTKSNYKIKGLKENTRSESGVVALITGLNSTELDSSDTPKELSEWFNLISKKAELGTSIAPVSEEVLDEATKKNTTKDIILNFFAEETYQDSRDAGNFIDDAKDYLESGSKPKFDKAKITQEAYDSLFNDVDGYLTQIKRKVDSGEFYLIGRDLVVYDSNIVRPDGTTDRIAGEIDLLLATDKGIMIVDIKSGEMKKWQGFNSLSESKDKKVFTKREEYTLQQAAYATMLEKMIDAPVAAIALLPVQRSSNKDTDQMVTAGKPETLSIYGKLEYQYDADGKPVKNDAGESVFTLKNERASDWLVPLYRESVQDKIDMLFPPGAVKFVPGMKTAANKQFKIYADAINKLSNKATKANLNALASIEKSINEFVAKNNIPISTELSTALEAKRKAYGAEASKNTITNTISKYQNAADNSKAAIDRIAKRLGDIKSLVVFDNIDLSPESDFIAEQLASDPAFKERYEAHEKYFIDSMGEPTPGQELAANVLNQSGILTDEEYAAVQDGELNMSEISELIHESVKRIQYIKVNSENDAEAKKFTDYQKDVFNLIKNTKWNESNAAFLAVLTNAQDNVNSGDVASAINNLDAEIARTELGLENTRLADYQKKNLNERLTDLTNFKNAIIEVTGYTPIEEILTEVEEEIESEEIDLDGLPEENILKVGDKLYPKSGTFVEYTVTKINKDNTVELKDENGKKVTTTMDKFNEDYITQDQILGEDVTDTYVPTPSEVSVTKESQDTVDSFIKNETAVGEGYEEGVNNSAAQLRKNLLNKTKYCP